MKRYFNYVLLILLSMSTLAYAQENTPVVGKVWSLEKANAWYKQYKWINGADFLPSTAINQLEMWQKDTFEVVLHKLMEEPLV